MGLARPENTPNYGGFLKGLKYIAGEPIHPPRDPRDSLGTPPKNTLHQIVHGLHGDTYNTVSSLL